MANHRQQAAHTLRVVTSRLKSTADFSAHSRVAHIVHINMLHERNTHCQTCIPPLYSAAAG